MSERDDPVNAPPATPGEPAQAAESTSTSGDLRLFNLLFPRGFPSPIKRGPGPAILMYHQVVELEDDHWAMAVTPRNFEEHLQVLRQHCRPLGLPHLTTDMIRGQLDPRSVVITFDDGYRDNLLNAKPLLERYDVPATVFVVGDAIGRDTEFWWDELHYVFMSDHPLPESLELTIAGRKRTWRLAEQNAFPGLRTRWTRARLHRALWDELRLRPASERSEVLAALREWAGHPLRVRPGRQVMNEAELLELASGHLIEIGAHTMSHPRLSALHPEDQFAEVREGKAHLEEILGHTITSFSYPFGGTFDVTRESVKAVRMAGFTRACTMRQGVTRPSTNLLRLPRIAVGDWSGEEFERRMAAWLPL